jgi:Uma2 family endonuclease
MTQTAIMPSWAANGSPTWEIAHLFPTQGEWCEEDYLALQGNRLLELSNGFLEVLPMPTTSHQLIVVFLYRLLFAYINSRDLGTLLLAPLRVRLGRGKFREPDILFMSKEHKDRIGEKFWKGADLVVEVVSGEEEDRHRDLVIKRREYARAGIAEYWIVDPEQGRFTVLRLAGKRYVVHGEFAKGTAAISHLLRGFRVEVTEALSQGAGRVAAKGRKQPKR